MFAKQPLMTIYIKIYTNIYAFFFYLQQLIYKENIINFVNGTMKTKCPNSLRIMA